MGRCGGKAAACERCCVPKPVRHFPGERARVTRKGRRAESRLARRLSRGTRRAEVASEQRDQERIAVQVGGVNPARLRARLLEVAVPALAEFIDTVRRNGITGIARRPQHEGRYFTTPTWREWRAWARDPELTLGRRVSLRSPSPCERCIGWTSTAQDINRFVDAPVAD